MPTFSQDSPEIVVAHHLAQRNSQVYIAYGLMETYLGQREAAEDVLRRGREALGPDFDLTRQGSGVGGVTYDINDLGEP